MLAHTILALGTFAFSSVFAQDFTYAPATSDVNACEASPYRGLGCLASNTAAASECSSRVPAVTSTTTSTTSVLAEITESPRVMTKVQSQVTISSTNIKDTVTVTVTL
jgi:hypothetical protein